ncbi:unnamed protein product [Calypogeia fissa]
MKALAERRAGKRSVKASTSQVEANVFHLEVEPKFGSMAYKKQLADRIQEKSGWDAPVFFVSIIVEVGAAWDANIEDKRKTGKAEGEMRRKEKRWKDEVGTSTPAPAPPPASVPESEIKETEKPVRKSPRWILGRDVDQLVFPKVMAEKFWNQPVQGFINGDLFGSMRRNIQEAILLRSKRKRILRKGPSNMLGILFGEEKGESKADVFAAVVDVVEEESQEASLVSTYRSSKNPLEGFWVRACNECEVELLGAGDSMKALLDSGSEVNLMSRELYEDGGWLID